MRLRKQAKPVFFGGNGLNSLDQEMQRNRKMIEVGSRILSIAGKASTDWLIDQDSVILQRRKGGELFCGCLSHIELISLLPNEVSRIV